MSQRNRKKAHIIQAVIPVKALLYRSSLIFFILLSLAVIAVGRIDSRVVGKLRTDVMDIVTPILSALSAPIQAYTTLKADLNHMIFVYQENQQLLTENMRLKQLQSVVIELEAENKRLRNVVKFLPSNGLTYLSARVVGDTGGPYRRSAIINSGIISGVKSGNIVINEKGLVGRITDAGSNSSRVLLVTDITSRVPIMTEQSRERAVLTGNNTEFPLLTYLPEDTNVRVGERIITSGDGKLFPAGIAIGVVRSISKKAIDIKPFVDWSRLEYVSITEKASK